MSRGKSVMQMVWLSAIVLTVALMAWTVGLCQTASQSGGTESFFGSLPGDWIGTVSQSTDGKFGDTKYFHAAVKQLSPDIYESVFTHYRLDEKSGDPVLVGVSSVATKIATDGTATNTLIGKGDILVDVNSRKPETHELTETLRASPTGGLEGTGSGSISVAGMPLGIGKNGKVQGYSSTWSVSNDVLKISQRFKVEFRTFFFRKSFVITADYAAKRGSDVIGLMKVAATELPAR